MSMTTMLLALAAAAPEVPRTHVHVVEEDGGYVMRNVIDNNHLYTFDLDEPGKSNCLDDCAATWRPLWATADATPVGRWSVIMRADGSSQWAYAGKPVYSFAQEPESVAMADGRVGSWRLLPTVPMR